MVQKSYPVNILSDVTCSTSKCNRRLKLRIVEETEHKICFSCHKVKERQRGHFMK